MQLTEKQRKFLRGKAHPLEPVVRIGNNGLTDGVVAETARALLDHELVKVKVSAADRDSRDAMIAELAKRSDSALVHRIGHVAVLYRANPELPKILLPAD